MLKGRIVRIESKDFYVEIEGRTIVRSTLPGKLKRRFKLKKDKLFTLDIASVGDIVYIDVNNDGSGVIQKIEARRNYISRKAPRIKGASYRGERLEQIVASNIDELFIVSSIKQPNLKKGVIDRILVAGESSNITTKIIINKVDLDREHESNFWYQLYTGIGYDVFLTSAISGEGIDNLRSHLKGKASMFWGQSGVGKSSLFNRLFPELNFKAAPVSGISEKGKHSTVTCVLKNLDSGTYVIDTPGIREIDPYGITRTDLSHYFIEFAEASGNCKFNTCTHHHEPGCAVIDAVEKGDISFERYESYLNLLESVEDDINF